MNITRKPDTNAAPRTLDSDDIMNYVASITTAIEARQLFDELVIRARRLNPTYTWDDCVYAVRLNILSHATALPEYDRISVLFGDLA